MFLHIRCLALFLHSRFGSLSHLKDVIVGGLKIQKLYQEHLESTTTTDIRPTITEYESSWWIRNHLEKSRKRAHSSFRVSSSVCTTDIISLKKWFKDEVICELNVRVFKLETIIQVLARERNEEYGVLHFNEEFSSLGRDFMDSLNILFQDLIQPYYSDEDISNEKNIIEEQRFRVEEPKRMRLEEEKLLQIADQQGQVKCKFPWSDDYIVGWDFWLTLACLEPSRKGWLSEEHIDLWVNYMWHERPDNANWAMVSCYFVQICHTLTMAETRERNIMINHNTRYKIKKTTMHKLQVLRRPSASNNLE
ncbi:hypothetical protein Tco_1569887 [Tanacetum coccineum]